MLCYISNLIFQETLLRQRLNIATLGPIGPDWLYRSSGQATGQATSQPGSQPFALLFWNNRRPKDDFLGQHIFKEREKERRREGKKETEKHGKKERRKEVKREGRIERINERKK